MALGLRFLFRSAKRAGPLVSRGIAMTPAKLEKAVEKLAQNPYYEKYAERIAQLQRTSPEEFVQRVEGAAAARDAERRTKFAPIDIRQFSSVLNPKEALEGEIDGDDKKLEKIFKIELVKDKDAEEIKLIWEEYHKQKEVLSATIPLDLYKGIHERMDQCPTFLFPLPRSEGYEFILCQSYGHTAHFTPLLAYQVHKENAPECLTMVHYVELQDKQIVLMRGEYDKNVLTGQEAQCLANQFQLYYNGKDSTKLQLLETFTKSPDSFKHMELISQLENITLT